MTPRDWFALGSLVIAVGGVVALVAISVALRTRDRQDFEWLRDDHNDLRKEHNALRVDVSRLEGREGVRE